VVARLAVGLGLALEEVLGTELELAVAAREVLGVPSLAQCCYDLAYNSLLAGEAAALLSGGDPLLRHVGGEATKHAVQCVHGTLCLFGGGGSTGTGGGR